MSALIVLVFVVQILRKCLSPALPFQGMSHAGTETCSLSLLTGSREQSSTCRLGPAPGLRNMMGTCVCVCVGGMEWGECGCGRDGRSVSG